VNVNLTRQVLIRLSEEPMSLEELAEKTGVEKRKVYRVLSSLHTSRRVVHFRDDDGVRRYRPVEEF
jgi:DNA-binding IclR family transcriptional regulator